MTDGINYDAFSEALNDKADRDLQNVDTVSGGDAVIAFQRPTAENNYTWFRKYASGWVEQGGRITTTNTWGVATATLPIEMADTNYTIFITDIRPDTTAFTDQTNTTNRHTTRSSVANITTTSFQHQTHDTISWLVSGMAAQ